jgi:hypothetical protein
MPFAHKERVPPQLLEEGKGHSLLDFEHTLGNPGHLKGLSDVHSLGYMQSNSLSWQLPSGHTTYL